MENIIKGRINKILENKSNVVLIETGAGNVIYNTLCKYPNTASKIVYYAESPNNFEYNRDKYLHADNVRAVSPDVCFNFINYHSELNTEKIILVNTIQIANDNKTCSHGWFGLFVDGEKLFFHYTIPNNKSRLEQLEIISLIGLDILASQGNIDLLINGYIDNILNTETPIKDTLTVLKNGYVNTSNHCMILSKDGELIRLEDYLRKNSEVYVFKGSFDPLHEEHINIAKTRRNTLMCISLNNRDKNKSVSISNILKRIKLLYKYGFDIMIDTRGYYKDSYDLITSNTSFTDDHILHYLMGSDTTERLISDFKDDFNSVEEFNNYYNKCSFYNYHRANVSDVSLEGFNNIFNFENTFKALSSTLIRSYIKEQKIDNLTELGLSLEYITNLKNTYGPI